MIFFQALVILHLRVLEEDVSDSLLTDFRSVLASPQTGSDTADLDDRPDWCQREDWLRLRGSISQDNWSKISAELEAREEQWRQWYESGLVAGIADIACKTSSYSVSIIAKSIFAHFLRRCFKKL